MLDSWALRNSAWKKKIATRLYEGAHLKGAACLVALCESEAASMRALGLGNAITIIPSGQELPLETSAMRDGERSGMEAGRKVMLFLGRLHPKKGLPALLRAWAGCRKAEPEAAHWMLVLGGGDQDGHERELRRLILELDLDGSVLLAGPLFDEKKLHALNRADAFVLPSLSEGLPVAVLEAWAWRLPVLMTPQCNLPEGFAAGAAVKVEPNVESLTHGLTALFRMSECERERMGSCGRRLVEERFSWRRAAEQTVSVYKWVCAAGPRPDCMAE
jgi:poly(glycerol-phosphate) alpha-glucosyltransferase